MSMLQTARRADDVDLSEIAERVVGFRGPLTTAACIRDTNDIDLSLSEDP